MKGSAVVTAAGSARSRLAIRSPAARMEPSGSRHRSVPDKGGGTHVNGDASIQPLDQRPTMRPWCFACRIPKYSNRNSCNLDKG